MRSGCDSQVVRTDDHELRRGVLAAAHHPDAVLLAPLAVGAALTGITLAAATPYGFFHHWWVTVKFAITVVQLYVGIFVLSGILNAATADPASLSGPLIALPAALMAAAIAFQAWLSIDKPWGRTRWSARRPKPVAGPRWMFAVTCAAVVVDLVVGAVTGAPLPLASVAALVAVLVGRLRPNAALNPRTAGSRSPAR